MSSLYRDVSPGQSVSASQFNELLAAVRRIAQFTAAPPLEVIRAPDGIHLRFADEGGCWAKITGKDKEDPAATPPDANYSGQEQISYRDTLGTADLDSGLSFFADTYPLKEATGRTDVATNTVVYAIPAEDDTHYLFEQPSGSGTNACPDAPTIPGGFTCLDDSCCLPPLLEAQRSSFDGQCYYRWVIVCLYNGKFHTCQGAWTTTYPTSDPYGVPIPDPSGAAPATVFPDAVFPTPVFPAPVFP